MRMKRAIFWGVLALIIAVLFASFALFYRHPLAVMAAMERSTLKRKGFQKTTLSAPSGPMFVWEAGRGPTVVLLHGAGDQAGAWSRVAPSLTSSYRVLIPDLPGHGDSAPAEGPLTIGMELAGVERLVDLDAPGQPVILVGNSMGGWLAMLYAHRHPERVARIVLVNGGALRGHRPLNLLPATRTEAERMVGMLRDPLSPPVPTFVIDDVVRAAHDGPLARLAGTAADMENYLLDGRLQEIKVPADLLWGQSDQMMDLDYAHRMEAELPAVRLTLLTHCGHVPTRECPEQFTAKLGDLLRQPAPAPRAVAPIASSAGK